MAVCLGYLMIRKGINSLGQNSGLNLDYFDQKGTKVRYLLLKEKKQGIIFSIVNLDCRISTRILRMSNYDGSAVTNLNYSLCLAWKANSSFVLQKCDIVGFYFVLFPIIYSLKKTCLPLPKCLTDVWLLPVAVFSYC